MKDSRLLSVRLAKVFLVMMALILLVFIVCYATRPTGTPYNEFTSPHPPLSTHDKILAISLLGFVLGIPFSFALNALALYVNREVVKLGRVLQAVLAIALIGFIAVPVVLFVDEHIALRIFGVIAAVPIAMWLVSCCYLFRLDAKWRKIIPDDGMV